MNATAHSSLPWISEYRALVEQAGVVDLGPRVQIELSGADRASFLHNLCTNEIRKLPVDAGCEAFMTSVQGKTLAHVLVFAGPESLVIDSVPGESEKLLAHLDHYLVSEQVTLTDRTEDWRELLLAGPQAGEILQRLIGQPPPTKHLHHLTTNLANKAVSVRKVDFTGPHDFLINARAEDLPAVRDALLAAGAIPCEQAAFHAARIERGFPWFGADLNEKNLPQELARDTQAISFVKGCYLGQETVARIDALGHVNKTLVGLRFDGPTVPSPGDELTAGGQNAGQVTSASYSPQLGVPLALGYVRRGNNAVGTRLDSAAGPCEVISLPVR